MKNKEVELEVIYSGLEDQELNAQLDVCAEIHGGRFLSFDEKKLKNYCIRIYSFIEDDLLDEFYEKANFIISKNFPLAVCNLEEFPNKMKWGPDEAIYHHLEFEQVKDAQNFATSIRGLFMAYSAADMFDVILLKDPEVSNSYYVFFGFPAESEVFFGDDHGDSYGEDFPPITKKNKNELN